MDYEKLYKEARDRATKVIMKCRPLSTEANLAVHHALSYVFPATTDSEDEEIRQMIENTLREAVLSESISETSYWEMLAYLEKQKEQKAAEWNEEDEKMLSDCIEAVGSMSVRSDVKTLRDWLKSLRPQPHWKPSEEQMKAMEQVRTILHHHHLWDEINPILYDYEELMRDIYKLL